MSRPTAVHARFTWRSSWTAIVAGPGPTACPSSRATARGSTRSTGWWSTSIRRGISVLSLYAFSRENWARSEAEVAGLFSLLDQAIRAETPELVRQGVRVRVAGRLAEVPADVRDSITEALAATEGGTRLVLNIAFNYAGRTEIVDAVRAIVAAGTPADEIDEATIAARLYTAGLPDPDLVIRTGGEQRLSNFLIWQSAYAEFHSCPALWPDFDADAFDTALEEYAGRGRRFGR